MKHRFIILLLSVVCCLPSLFTGCGNQQKLGGKVTFADGSPLKTGTIFFSNDSFLGRAFIHSDGTYDVGSFAEKDGLPPGKYKVYITGAVEVTGTTKRKETTVGEDGKSRTIEIEEEILSSLIADKYANRDTTPLEVEVPGDRVYHIQVEKP